MRKRGSSPVPAPPALSGDERLALSALGAIVMITASWWALALWPLQTAPEWLSRTRAVCFGVAPGGLPDGGGWILLIGQPLSMVGFLLVVWGRTVRRALVCTMSRPAGGVVLAGVAVALLAGFTGAAVRIASVALEPAFAPRLSAEVWPRLDRDAPALRLVDQHGQPFDLTDLRGRPVLLTFAYAHCETVCPAIVKQVQAARDDAAVTGTVVVVVSIDPWRDSPARLPSIAERWGLGPRDVVLSGEIDDVQSVLEAWNVPISRNPDTGVIDHPAVVYVIGRDGRIRYAATGGADLIADLLRRG